ncbi:conjugative transposon protein TraM [Dyadobacter arcticus]|uniref:Conjugative transposon TraM protein n=1 Tax=Dyadobacter arcticus TaxID=1078754 RepID=A0ABX0UNF3_9BACT|nr:conjugative transposon protein TraM [Dyadobacter arcticus]NIJ52611.1 conjugative transposon TraM protein [Dyadobacter arcticus]
MKLKTKKYTTHIARQGIRKQHVLFFMILSLTSCKNDPQKLKPSMEPITESVYASGIVKSKNQYQVYASAAGIISRILVSKGDIISKGTPLVQITNTAAKLNTENALLNAQYASVASNKEKLDELSMAIRLANTKLDNDLSLLQRQKNLWAQKVGTSNDLDARQLTYANSKNGYQTAKLRFAEMQKQISFQQKQSRKTLEISKTASGDFTVRSERDGKVYDILKESGEMVNTINPIALVGDANDFLLELQIDENDITRIKAGQKMLLTMDSYKGQIFEAIVDKVIPVAGLDEEALVPESDPEMQELSGMLDKIMQIQNPDLAASKLTEQSIANQKQVFPVIQSSDQANITLLGGADTHSDSAATRHPDRLSASTGFYSLENSEPSSTNLPAIEAVIDQNQTLVTGATIKLRLSTDVFIAGKRIPAGSFLYGKASLNQERLRVVIESVRSDNGLFPISLSVYDMDGMEGIYIPGAISRDVGKQSSDRAIQGINIPMLDPSLGAQAASAGIEAAKTFLGRKAKLIQVTVKAGYRVLLKDVNAKSI